MNNRGCEISVPSIQRRASKSKNWFKYRLNSRLSPFYPYPIYHGSSRRKGNECFNTLVSFQRDNISLYIYSFTHTLSSLPYFLAFLFFLFLSSTMIQHFLEIIRVDSRLFIEYLIIEQTRTNVKNIIASLNVYASPIRTYFEMDRSCVCVCTRMLECATVEENFDQSTRMIGRKLGRKIRCRLRATPSFYSSHFHLCRFHRVCIYTGINDTLRNDILFSLRIIELSFDSRYFSKRDFISFCF